MDKSLKNSLRCNSLLAELLPSLINSFSLKPAALLLSAGFFSFGAFAAAPTISPTPTPQKNSGSSVETYRDLVTKAQNLTLQRDRLQTSQVLIRGLQRENKTSAAYRELSRALEDLTSVFYTEKAQGLFATGESQMESKPHDAIDQFQEALRIEDGNITILKAIARTHLRLAECSKADTAIKSAEGMNPYSSEIKLLRLQVLECQKSYDLLALRLAAHDPDLESVEKFSRGLQVADLIRQKELKKAKMLLSNWETQMPDYPEVYYWKWQLAKETGDPERLAAVKYAQLCQNLTPRRRNNYILDVDLCKGKEVVDAYLRETGLPGSKPPPTPGETK